MKEFNLIIDFDSTLVTIESLELLAEIALEDKKNKEKIVDQIKQITADGMSGKIPFHDSLTRRIALFSANKQHVEKMNKLIGKYITPSFKRNKNFFKKYKNQIFIISGGFKEYIIPFGKKLGILKENILANEFTFDKKGNITGLNTSIPLSRAGGKPETIRQLKLKGETYIIGDGYTDYEIKKEKFAHLFFAFTENVKRVSVIKYADHIVNSFDECLFILNLPRATSYPKTKMTALLLENIHPLAADLLKKEGYKVKQVKGAMSGDELIKEMSHISLLGIRSKTIISEKVLSKAPKLLAIGAFCIGTNQIHLKAAAEKGIAVFNAPYSNTRSVVELVLGEIIMLIRKIPDKNNNLHKGIWDKSAGGSHEIRGKKLGIIGYGNIGSQLSVLAENLGMEVYFYDVVEKLALGNAKKCTTLKELLKTADIVTVHVDGRSANKNLIGEEEFNLMKQGTIFLNLSRGHIVNIDALTQHIKSGKIAGAAVDVFPSEPKSNDEKFKSSLQHLPNIILTPHVGGSTEEAQENIGNFVANKLITFINTGNTTLSVNLPQMQLPEFKGRHRLIHIHKNEPGILAKINSILANHHVNIEGQYLKTTEDIGYVITDINQSYDKSLVQELKDIQSTIKIRVLY